MSLIAARSLTRIISPLRRYYSCISIRHFSSEKTPTDPPKESEYKYKPPVPPSVSARIPPEESAAKKEAIEKGDTYKAGEQYYNFDTYSYYDLDNDLKSKRMPQPCSGEKMKIFCMDKLSLEDPKPRRLLPEHYGYLVEWPGKKEASTKYKPVKPIIENSYGLLLDPEKDPFGHARIPL